MKIEIVFEDGDPKADFLNVMIATNLQHFIDEVGLTDQTELIGVTEDEKVGYVENVWTATVIETYKAQKVQQEAQAYAAARQEAVKDSITGAKTPIKREKV